jgi:hypothetical protein
MEQSMTETLVAQPLDPTAVILEDFVEIRPCSRCRTRLILSVHDVGQIVSCPNCNLVGRALPVAGPFAHVHIERHVGNEPTLDGRYQPTERLAEVPFAPLVAPREYDPIDESSAIVDGIGVLQWIAAISLSLVAINQGFWYWGADELAASQERSIATILGFSLLCAALYLLAGLGIRQRSIYGWGLSLACSALTTFAISVILYQRTAGQTGRFSEYHLGILFSVPAFLCAIVSLVILLTPRYFREFRKPVT